MKKRSLSLSLLMLIPGLLFLVALGLSPSPARAQQAAPQAITSDTFANLAKETGTAVVNVSTEKKVKNQTGQIQPGGSQEGRCDVVRPHGRAIYRGV